MKFTEIEKQCRFYLKGGLCSNKYAPNPTHSRCIGHRMCSEWRDNHNKVSEAIAIAEDAQGEWSSVTKTYSPDWTHPYKAIIDLLEEALIEAEEAAT